METGRDLIFKWIPRMIIFGLYLGKKTPFKTIYLHGLVNDAQGKKMSKSKGNVINPLDLIEKYGTDALRMGLVIGNTPGMDLAMREDKVKGYKHFANKLWNIARFVLDHEEHIPSEKPAGLSADDEKDLAELDETVRTITKNLNDYRIDLAADAAYHYVWGTFADRIIEASKPALKGNDADARVRTAWRLYTILTTSLKLLHPFMPFVTERIWAELPHKDNDMLMVAEWPVVKVD